MYGCDELGEKLRKLRPDEAGKGKTGWFSLQELNERLVKLRELESKQPESTLSSSFRDLHNSLSKLKEIEVNKKAADMQKMLIFRRRRRGARDAAAPATLVISGDAGGLRTGGEAEM